MDPNPTFNLFEGQNLSDYLDGLQKELKKQIESAPEDYVLGVNIKEWAVQMEDKFTLQVPELHADRAEVEDNGEVKIESGVTVVVGKGREKRYLNGRQYSVHVPFDGDAHLFRLQPPYGQRLPDPVRVHNQELMFGFTERSGEAPKLKAKLDTYLGMVNGNLAAQKREVAAYNGRVKLNALKWMEDRKARLLADQTNLANLGLPVRKRDDAPKTYNADTIVRRPAPQVQGGTSSPSSVPEPVLLDAFYDHICQVVRVTSNAMERTPQRYRDQNEEALRDQYLTMLNSHYEGKAVGEAFQNQGKTDILIREQDKNLFVGECKWWSGQKAFGEAIDQLFGYSTWRDTKLALLVFVKNRDLTAVLEAAKQRLEEHPQFKGWKTADSETELKAEMSWPGDDGRRATLTVFFVHLPDD